MRQRILRTILRIAGAGILFVLLFTGIAAAENEAVIRVGCPSRSAETVVARKSKAGYILSIPGHWDITALTMEVEGTDCVLLGREKREIRPGEITDFSALAGQKSSLSKPSGLVIGNLTIYQGSEIPCLFLHVDPAELKQINRSKDNEITSGRAVYTQGDGTVAYDGGITQIRCRGNNTFSYSKKPYQIKLADKASLTGENAGKTWVLLANWNDHSLLRNQIVMDLARDAGLPNAVSCIQADIWINGSYNGLYLITEKIQIKKGRLELADLEDRTEEVNSKPVSSFACFKTKTENLQLLRAYRVGENPEDITGGYILTIEKYTRLRDYAVPGFRTQKDLSVRIKEPTYPSAEQAEYIGNLVNEMHQAVIAKDGICAKTRKHYTEYIDSDSFALKFLIEEWCKNYDILGGSQYMYKDSDARNPLIYAGPAWDYDLSFGNMKDRGASATGDYVTATSRRTSNLYWLLSRHTEFDTLVRTIWRDRFRPAAGILLGSKRDGYDGILVSLDEYADRIEKSAEMNFARWGYQSKATGPNGKNFRDAVRILKDWISRRTEYMDKRYKIQD